MPLNATAMQSLDQADVWEITRIIIEATSRQLVIVYRVGLRQADGDVQWIRDNLSFMADARGLAAQSPDGTKTWYANLKALAYQLGQQTGGFPQGTVT